MVEQTRYPKRRIESEPFLSQLDVIEKARIDLHSVPARLFPASTNRKPAYNYNNISNSPSVALNDVSRNSGGIAQSGLSSLESLTPSMHVSNMIQSSSIDFNNITNSGLLVNNASASSGSVFDPFNSVNLNKPVGLGSNNDKSLFSSTFMDSYEKHGLQSSNTPNAPPNIWGDYNEKGFSGDATVWG